MKTIIQLLLVCLTAVTLSAAESAKPAAFQMRLVQDGAGPDTEQMAITHSTKDENPTYKEVLHVQKTLLIDHTALSSAVVQKDVIRGNPEIEITFTDKGRKLFAEVTRQNVGKRLAIVVDGKLLSAPKIIMGIPGGKGVISGNFSEQESKELTTKINEAVKK